MGGARNPPPVERGHRKFSDCEYRRNGSVNLFVCIDVNRPWRKVKVTERRAAEDYAHCTRELPDVPYPAAPCIRAGHDNLSTPPAAPPPAPLPPPHPPPLPPPPH